MPFTLDPQNPVIQLVSFGPAPMCIGCRRRRATFRAIVDGIAYLLCAHCAADAR